MQSHKMCAKICDNSKGKSELKNKPTCSLTLVCTKCMTKTRLIVVIIHTGTLCAFCMERIRILVRGCTPLRERHTTSQGSGNNEPRISCRFFSLFPILILAFCAKLNASAGEEPCISKLSSSRNRIKTMFHRKMLVFS